MDALDIAEHYDVIRRYLRRHTKTPEDAEDVTQIVFAEAIARRPQLVAEEQTPLLAWLYTVARRRSIDLARKRRREPMHFPLYDHDQEAGTDSYGTDVRRALEQAIAEFPVNQRGVVVRRLIQGWSFAEIAGVEGASEAACKRAEPPLGSPRIGVVLRGRCACEVIGFEVSDEFVVAYNCHCSNCRAATGSAFCPWGEIEPEKLRVTRGSDSLILIGDPDGPHARHCGECFSLVYWTGYQGKIRVPYGSLVDEPALKPMAHMFVGSKAAWYEILDDLPQHAEYPW